ncbi:class I SAM-dependent methyltransferase [Nocardioides sp. R1-1]|uniref:class I SAM-dependent methyltransferase n=1 Tax=Nocardioides sp. R1-1 TaxID=3383502 RepID=UPI0038D2492F
MSEHTEHTEHTEHVEHTFDQDYWDRHYAAGGGAGLPVHPYLPAETVGLAIGSALDAGCGNGAQALWLAERGWDVVATDISRAALDAAADRARSAGLDDRVDWVRADLTAWEPDRTWDLVVTSYAHADAGQLELYRRVGEWVAPGGTLLVIAHAPARAHGHRHTHPEHAAATIDEVVDLFSGADWLVDAAYEASRTVTPRGRTVELHDVVVRVHRAR